jgi:hypothetical protein
LLLPSHRRALRDIVACRTATLGGHVQACDHCGTRQYSHHSCRNRHCPTCHGEQTQRWLERQRTRLLPCAYFLLTFTVPAELRALARAHQKIVYGVLMTAAAAALPTLTADPRYLGARPGLLAVLHTWTRALLYHPHVHMLVTAGGLRGCSTDQTWVRPRHTAFLVPGRALSRLFRGNVRAGLRKAGLLEQVPLAVWRHEWVVHVQHAGTGEKVLDYLARYVFRIPIVNSRLEQLEDGHVTFRYRDGQTGLIKRCTLDAVAFLGRFLQHVLPQGFTQVRHYGLFSPSRHDLLDQARKHLIAASVNPRQPIGPRSPPRPRPLRTAHRTRAARPAGSGCCTSSKPFARGVARHDHAATRPPAVPAGAASPGGGRRRRLSRGRPSRSQPAPARRSRAGSTVALTDHEPSRRFDTSSSDPRTALNLQTCRQRRDRVQHRLLPRLRAAKSLNSLDGLLSSKDDVDSGEHQFELGSDELASSFREVGLVQRHELGNVGDRLLREAGRARRKANVPRRRCPLQIACQGDADDGGDTASIERIALYDHDGTSEAWPGATWLWQVGPPDISLSDRHQSLRLRTRREAVRAN